MLCMVENKVKMQCKFLNVQSLLRLLPIFFPNSTYTN